jgi:predicted Zn-dependent peptidase
MNTSNVDQALEAILEIMNGMITNPPAGEELERAKRYYSGQLRSSFDGPFAMTQKLKNLFVRNYSFQHYDTALKSIWTATTDDLCRIADNYLHPESFNTVLAGDVEP